MLTTNQPVAISNLVQSQTGITIPVSGTNDPVEQALDKIMKADNAARAEVDKWITDNEAFGEKGAGVPRAARTFSTPTCSTAPNWVSPRTSPRAPSC